MPIRRQVDSANASGTPEEFADALEQMLLGAERHITTGAESDLEHATAAAVPPGAAA